VLQRLYKSSTPAVNGGALYHVGDNWQTFFSGHFRNVRTTKGQSTPLADNNSYYYINTDKIDAITPASLA